MSRLTNHSSAFCFTLLLGLTATSMADDPGSTSGIVHVSAEAPGEARDSVPLIFALPMQGFAVDGGDYRLSCSIGTFRLSTNPSPPRKGVKGTFTADLHLCDPEEAPITCTGGLRVFRGRFKTDVGGFADIGVVITAEQLGSLLDGSPPSAHPSAIATARFTNRKRVGQANLGCHIAPEPGG